MARESLDVVDGRLREPRLPDPAGRARPRGHRRAGSRSARTLTGSVAPRARLGRARARARRPGPARRQRRRVLRRVRARARRAGAGADRGGALSASPRATGRPRRRQVSASICAPTLSVGPMTETRRNLMRSIIVDGSLHWLLIGLGCASTGSVEKLEGRVAALEERARTPTRHASNRSMSRSTPPRLRSARRAARRPRKPRRARRRRARTMRRAAPTRCSRSRCRSRRVGGGSGSRPTGTGTPRASSTRAPGRARDRRDSRMPERARRAQRSASGPG